MKKLNKDDEIKELKECYNQAIKDNTKLLNDNVLLNERLEKLEMGNNKYYGRITEYEIKYYELKGKYDNLEKYVKHIQEYLLKDILDLMSED